MDHLSETQQEIVHLGAEIVDMLLEKNRRYGDSALEPIRVFSQADDVEQLRIRLDDKLSRIISSQRDDDEDVLLDLVGYLYLLIIAERRSRNNQMNLFTPPSDLQQRFERLARD